MTNNSASKKSILYIIAAIVLIGIAAFAFYFVDVDQTKEAVLPDVNVTVEGGQLPKFDVDTGSINVDTKTVEVDMPTAEIKTKTIEIEVPVGVEAGTEKSTIEVPTLNMDAPEQDSPADK